MEIANQEKEVRVVTVKMTKDLGMYRGEVQINEELENIKNNQIGEYSN